MINLAPALVKTERFHNNAYCTIEWSQSLSMYSWQTVKINQK